MSVFQKGDADNLRFVLSGEYARANCQCKHCAETTEMLRRLAEAARKEEPIS